MHPDSSLLRPPPSRGRGRGTFRGRGAPRGRGARPNLRLSGFTLDNRPPVFRLQGTMPSGSLVNLWASSISHFTN